MSDGYNERQPIQFYLLRLLAYTLLSFFGLVMLFPFIYMVSTSLKTSNDVFRFPPRILPYSPITTEYEGQQAPLYRFERDGETLELVLTGEKATFGFFTTPELANPDTPRESQILLRFPLDEAIQLDEPLSLSKADGSEQTFDLYEVLHEGETLALPLAYRSTLDVFVSPDDPEIVEYAIARTAPRAEQVQFQFENYRTVFSLDLDLALVNTTLVTLGVAIGQLITSIFGGYAFSRIEFKGRDTIFIAYLGSIMIPFVVLIIPIYRLMVVMGWQGQLVALIVPWIFTAYGTFLMRQFFVTIPKEIEEAALLDGCSRFRILWTIFVPLSTPAIATLGIFSFLYAWNSFLWPLLIIGEGGGADGNNSVLTLALITLSNIYADQPNFVLTGAAITILPPVIVFILAQRYFIEGVATSGLKG